MLATVDVVLVLVVLVLVVLVLVTVTRVVVVEAAVVVDETTPVALAARTDETDVQAAFLLKSLS